MKSLAGWILAIVLVPLISASASVEKVPNWMYYRDLILNGTFDEFAKTDPISYQTQFQTWLRETPALATNAEFLLAYGSGLANSVVRDCDLEFDPDSQAALYSDAFVMLEKSVREGNNAIALTELAWMHKDGLGTPANDKKARSCCDRALAIVKSLGLDNPCTATILSNLALLSQDKGDHDPVLEATESTPATTNGFAWRYYCDLIMNRQFNEFTKVDPVKYRKQCRAMRQREAALGTNADFLLAHGAGLLHAAIRDTDSDEDTKASMLSEAFDVLRKSVNCGKSNNPVALQEFARAHEGLWGGWTDPREACACRKKALAMLERTLGPADSGLRQSLTEMADMYASMGGHLVEFPEEQPLRARAEAIGVIARAEKSLGPEHIDVVKPLDGLSELYRVAGNYWAAAQLSKRALAIRVKCLGPWNEDVASSLNNLGTVYYLMGDYVEAEPLYKRASEISEKVFGPDHPKVAASLSNLGQLYVAKGDYAAAEPLCNRALAIYEKQSGANEAAVATSVSNVWQLYVATSLSNLGQLYAKKGNYAAAEPLYERALAIFGEILTPDAPAITMSLSNLGQVYAAKGDYSAAESVFRRALGEYVAGQADPGVTNLMKNFGTSPVVFVVGRGRALGKMHGMPASIRTNPLFRKPLFFRGEKILCPEDPDAATLDNLGDLYIKMGDYGAVEPLFRKSLHIRESILGPEHPAVATSIDNLGRLYFAKGDYAAAEPLYSKRPGDDLLPRWGRW